MFFVFVGFTTLGYFVCMIAGIPYSFSFRLPLRIFGIIIIVSGFVLLGWLFGYRKPVDILVSTYVTLLKARGATPLENVSGRSEVLVVQGPYRYVRHPLYLSVVLLVLGWWLLLDYSFLLFSAFFLLLWFSFVVTPFEERELRAMFGEEYEKYSNEVPRIISFTKRKKSRKEG
jgi:protein-S-isoprenylcysteine O-methyltransferase Ste14